MVSGILPIQIGILSPGQTHFQSVRQRSMPLLTLTLGVVNQAKVAHNKAGRGGGGGGGLGKLEDGCLGCRTCWWSGAACLAPYSPAALAIQLQ